MTTKTGEKMIGTKFWKLKSRRKNGNLEDLKKAEFRASSKES